MAVTPAAVERGGGSPRARGGRAPRGRPAGRARPPRGRRPSASAPQRPASQPPPLEPGVGVGQALVAPPGSAPARPRASARDPQVELGGRDGGIGQVEVGVGQARDRDLVGRERRAVACSGPARPSTSASPTRGDDPAALDRDRLDEAEAVRPSPASVTIRPVTMRSSGIGRHAVIRPRPVASASEQVRERRPVEPGAQAQRQGDPRLGAAQVPASSAPARIQVAPPPGKA